MSRELAFGLLNQGNTGSELLAILDAIVADVEDANINDVAQYVAALNAPTAEEVAF